MVLNICCIPIIAFYFTEPDSLPKGLLSFYHTVSGEQPREAGHRLCVGEISNNYYESRGWTTFDPLKYIPYYNPKK